MSLLKLHKISTVVAIVSIFCTTILFFLYTADQVLTLDLFPQALEAIMLLITSASGSIAFGSSFISIVLSLYRVSEK